MKKVLFLLVAATAIMTACMQPKSQVTPLSIPHFKDAGKLDRWLVLGPIPCQVDTPAFNNDYLTAIGGESKAVLKKDTPLTFKDSSGKPVQTSIIEFKSLNHEVELKTPFPFDHHLAYAYAEYVAPTPGKYTFLFGSDDDAAIWVNGKKVHEYRGARGVKKGDDIFSVPLLMGANRILVKIGNRIQGWGFALQIVSEAEGKKLAEQSQREKAVKTFQEQRIVPVGWQRYMVNAKKAPQLDWENPVFAEMIIGPCRLKTRWFNEKGEEVAKPTTPGRYCAYVEGTTAAGMKIRRAVTLFCRPDQWEPWQDDTIKAYPELDAAGTVIDPKAMAENRQAISEATAFYLIDSMNETENGAALLAFLHEQKPGVKLADGKKINSPLVKNLEFQLLIKRKILGADKRYTPLPPPQKETGLNAPVLRSGTETEAGFKPGTAARLHEICREWYAASQEPFSTLIARNGVVIYHEAFGTTRSGKTIDINTPMWVASISKLLTGMMFAQLVDRKLVSVDDPIGKYLPDFPVTGPKAITFRHCFTHTTGLKGHWSFGGLANPWLDNSIANGLEILSPGKVHIYNGDGYNLAGKAMEVITGKSMPRLMQENLFGPLGVTDAFGDDLGGGFSVNSDGLAKVAQMLLNHGAYGNLRFFGEATYQQLLPQPLERYYPGITKEWGIGLVWMRDNDPQAGKNGIPADKTILSPHTIGHGAASSAIFLADPDRQLTVIQTRNNAGPDYKKFREKLLQEVAGSLTK